MEKFYMLNAQPPSLTILCFRAYFNLLQSQASPIQNKTNVYGESLKFFNMD